MESMTEKMRSETSNICGMTCISAFSPIFDDQLAAQYVLVNDRDFRIAKYRVTVTVTVTVNVTVSAFFISNLIFTHKVGLF